MFIYFYFKNTILQYYLFLTGFTRSYNSPINVFHNSPFCFFQIFALRQLEPSKFQKFVTNFIRGISLVMIPIAATVPSVSVPPLSNSVQTLSAVSVYSNFTLREGLDRFQLV